MPDTEDFTFLGSEIVTLDDEGDKDNEIIVGDEPELEVTFTLPEVPGANDVVELDSVDEGDLEVESDENVEVEEADEWDWKSRGLPRFLEWLSERMAGIPQHSGRESTGLERAYAYLEALNREISAAMRLDYKNEIDYNKAEKAREEIENGLERLLDRLESVKKSKFKRYDKKSKKKAAEFEENGFVKEAKSTHVGGIVVTVPIFISRIAKILINGSVSGGHSIEDMWEKLAKKYKLTDREEAEVMELLDNMGMTIRRDRGIALNEEFDPKSSDNFDWAANYHS